MDVPSASDEAPVMKAWSIRALPWAAGLSLTLAATLIVNQVFNYALSPLHRLFGDDSLDAFATAANVSFTAMWWARIAISAALAVALVLSWPQADTRRRRLLIVASGLLLTWGWWLITANVDVFGLADVTQLTPDVTIRATASLVVWTAVEVIAAGLLVWGGLQLRATARTGRPVLPADTSRSR